MIRSSKIIPLIFIGFLFLSSCGMEKDNSVKSTDKPQKEAHGAFAVDFNKGSLEQRQIDSLYSIFLNGRLDTIFVFEKNNDKFVRAGYFNSSFEAGQFALNTFINFGISGCKILNGEKLVSDDFIEFPFIGTYLGRPALYYFNLKEFNISLIWGRWGKKILSTRYTYKRDKAFFATALTFGQEGGFPFITDARVYLFEKNRNDVSLIKKFKTGNQLYLFKENEDSTKAVFTFIDSVSSNAFIQKEYLMNLDGEILNEDEKAFELISDGFPKAVKSAPEYFSPSGQKRILIQADGEKFFIHLLDKANRKNYKLFNSDVDLSDIKWSNDDSFTFLKSKTVYAPDSIGTVIYIANANEGNIKNAIEISGRSNFVVYGDFLVYDEGFAENSQIIFYNFRSGNIYYNLALEGGCGVDNIRYKE